ERRRQARAPRVRGCTERRSARTVRPPPRSAAIARSWPSPIPPELARYTLRGLRDSPDLGRRRRRWDVLNGARNGDCADIVTAMIEQRSRQTVHALQDPVGSSSPAARPHLHDGALKRTWRADGIRRPGFERFRKAIFHQALGTKRQRDVSV